MINIDADLEWIRKASTDISEHIDTLIACGVQCQHVTEFGVRDGFSTLAWVKSNPKRLVCYDIQDCACIPKIQSACSERGVSFEFKVKNTRCAVIEETELLFIDTWHASDQLKAELNMSACRVSKWIILHDTESFGEFGEDGQPGLKVAVCSFLMDKIGVWRLKEHFKNCNGLTILERV